MEELNYREKMEELKYKINYLKIEDFLEKEFIPRNIEYRKRDNNNYKKSKKYPYIFLNSILNLGLNFDESQYIIYYLNDKGIIICGDNKKYNFIIPNYYKNPNFKTNEEKEEELELFKQYKKTNDSKIRNDLVSRHLGLAKSIVKKYSAYYNCDKDDLESYALEGLVKAVDRFDYTLGICFSTYAYCMIDGYIKRGVIDNLANSGNKVRQFYFKIYPYIKKIEEEYGMSLYDNVGLVRFVLDLLIDENVIRPEQSKEIEKIILTNYHFSIEQTDIHIISDGGIDEVDDEIFINQVKDFIIDFLNKKCTSRQREVFIKRFGLDGEKPLTLLQIKDVIGTSRSRNLEIEQVVLEKLKKALIEWSITSCSYHDLGHSYISGKKYIKKDNRI